MVPAEESLYGQQQATPLRGNAAFNTLQNNLLLLTLPSYHSEGFVEETEGDPTPFDGSVTEDLVDSIQRVPPAKKKRSTSRSGGPLYTYCPPPSEVI